MIIRLLKAFPGPASVSKPLLQMASSFVALARERKKKHLKDLVENLDETYRPASC